MRTALHLIAFIFFCAASYSQAFTIEAKPILEHDDRQFLWFHPRASIIPNKPGHAVMTLQKHLHKSDFYSGLHVMYSSDSGQTWTAPEPKAELDWRAEDEHTTVAVCDVTPGWHAPSKKVLAFGVKVRYRNGEQVYDQPQSHAVAYTAYDPKKNTWQEWQFLEVPEPAGKFYIIGPGCTQWLVEKDGTIVLPVYFRGPDTEQYKSTVLHCKFKRNKLRYLTHGEELSLDVERGLVEPSITNFNGKYYLTIRNDQGGYVTTSNDSLDWDDIRPWTFDDGSPLGSYNTQQHWITRDDALFLVYTRRGANNDHVFRHRAPLFMAQVDPERLVVLRATEQVVIPERGATLGNFGVCEVSATEAWVTDAEGIWSDEARQRGATGATWLARITFPK